jgi:hypothetical protein
MAAMIRMIATTISSSINEKPFCFFKSFSSLVGAHRPHATYFAVRQPFSAGVLSPDQSSGNGVGAAEKKRHPDKICQLWLTQSGK